MATLNISYISEGKGFPVVFLHGFCESKEIWREFIPPFTERYHVIVPDMPGFGKSQGNTRYHRIDDMAGEIHTLLLNLDVQKCVIIAHSLGGYVALALAEAHPEVVQGLGLFHSTAYADSEEKKHTRNKTAEFIDKKGVEPFIENFVPGLFYKDRHPELRERIDWVKQLAVQTPRETAVAVTKAMRDRPDRTQVLQQLEVPVLFIAGEADEAVPLAGSEAQFSLPKEPVVHILPETAHMGMFERPQETRKMVEEFIARCVEG
jgi:pimeloyl-ACP methyl ester carboxylesterase